MASAELVSGRVLAALTGRPAARPLSVVPLRKAERPAEVNVGICRYVLRHVTRPV